MTFDDISIIMDLWSCFHVQKERIFPYQMNEKKYRALYRALKEKILLREYAPGTKLPSKRTLADRYGYSLMTVADALALLTDEGFIEPQERRGYFVCEWGDLFAGGAPVVAGAPDVADTSGTRTPLPPTCPPLPPDEKRENTHRFESSVWVRTVRRVLSERKEELFTRAPARGCAVLRNALSEYLSRYRSMHADPRYILIGSGAEQLYETIAKLLPVRTVFGVEDPGYAPVRAAYRAMGRRVHLLPLGEDGVQSEALASAGFDVLHVTPFHSYPSGVTTPASKRREYLAWAARRGGYIVEDDFDSEFFVPGHPIPTLFSCGGESVIYLNTFSKSLSPALRIGYLILPPALDARFEALFGSAACPVPVMDQYVLAQFISDGSFERHLNRIRRRMRDNLHT